MYVTSPVIRPRLEESARAVIPTRHGSFEMVVFRTLETQSAELALSPEPVAIVCGDVRGKRGVPVRVHSECITSEVFGSLKCDCKQQLEAAQAEIARRGVGVVLYLRQEGRGIGLANKLKAYALQDGGMDTVEANVHLGFRPDEREFGTGAQILHDLGVRRLQLLTNNPKKLAGLQGYGLEVVAQVPLVVSPNPHNEKYLETKRDKMGHLLTKPG